MMGLMSLLASCSFHEDVEEQAPALQLGKDMPIDFNSYIAQPVTTRSELVEGYIPNGKSIGVYAYYHQGADANDNGVVDEGEAGAWSSASTANFMFNQKVTYDENLYSFVYSPLKYWPNDPFDRLSFIAYYPYSNPDADPSSPDHPDNTGVTPTGIVNGLPTFTFTQNKDFDKQKDFIVTELLPNQKKGPIYGTEQVKLLFHHATAQVVFRIKVHPDIRQYFSKLKVNKLSIEKIKHTRDLTLTITETENMGWMHDDADALEVGDDGEFVIVDINEADPEDPTKHLNHINDPYLMVPQVLGLTTDDPSDAVLKMDYELTLKGFDTVYTYDNDGNPVQTDTYTYRKTDEQVKLKKIEIEGGKEWMANRRYIYTLTISANRIDYTGQVVDWGDEQSLSGDDGNGIPVEEE